MGGKFHIRSISLPSRSHPTTLRMEDELSSLKTWEASSCESISASLSGLEDLYQCMDDLLSMPSTRQVLSQHQHEKCIDDLLDGSVRLLDICGIARDAMFELKEHVHAFQSGLRRRKGDSSIENNILNYTKFRKELNRRGKKLITQLKKMEASSPPMEQEQDHHFSAVIRVLSQVNAMSTSIFQSFFSSLSAPVSSKQKRWCLVSRLMHKGAVSCEENVNELESVDAALCRHTSDVEKMQTAMVALENGIEGLEKRLEYLVRGTWNDANRDIGEKLKQIGTALHGWKSKQRRREVRKRKDLQSQIEHLLMQPITDANVQEMSKYKQELREVLKRDERTPFYTLKWDRTVAVACLLPFLWGDYYQCGPMVDSCISKASVNSLVYLKLETSQFRGTNNTYSVLEQ
ncbi:hypothetical protein V6N13_107116 [Hibiscus sabdariffa]|uniref:Uncharacterized protein n=1 Tax=Hibiscus sabdariffa TaxID=183260 RepID=A0ABR2F2W6_9ROSI